MAWRFLTGAYFTITTPGLDFQLFKTLITASSSEELTAQIVSFLNTLCALHVSGIKPLFACQSYQQLQSKALIRRDQHSKKPFRACLLTAVLSLSYYDNYTLYYAVKVSPWQLKLCLFHTDARGSLDKVFHVICSRHISHKEKRSTYILPRDWSSCLTGLLQHKVSPCYYVQPCRADDFYARGSRLNISVVFLTGKMFQAL